MVSEYGDNIHMHILAALILERGLSVNFIPEELHVLATRLATYVSSDSTTSKVTNR
jgi:hypothetical protein